MPSIIERLTEKRILVSDGAWGTSLMKRGFRLGECPELWNLDRPDDILDIARSYVEAGSDIVMTNSFGGSSIKLAPFGLGGRVAEINEAAARLSRQAAGADVCVMASVGPTGKFLMTGEVTEEQLYDGFREQAVALERGGADACCVETMMALDEALIAVRAARENTALEVFCTFTFEKNADGGFRTMMGTSPADIAQPLLDAGALALGTNCGHGPEDMADIVREIHAAVRVIRAAAPGVPIIAQANAGLPVTRDGVTVYPATPEIMAAAVPGLIAAGATIIGGCCGSTPDHIRAIAAAARESLSR